MAGGGDVGRLLGRMETAVAISDAAWPLNLAFTARISPAPDPEVMRSALDLVQRRHPPLRARIVREGRRLGFAYHDVAPIPVEVAARPDADAWIPAVEDALNTALPAAAGPLMACRLLSSDDGSVADLVLTFSHVIIDASSVANLLNEILSAYGDIAEGRPPASVDPLPVPPAVETLFPPGYRGARMQGRVAAFAAGQMPSEVRYRTAMRRAGAPEVRPDARTQVHTASLDAETTIALERVARRRRLTLVNVVEAALLLAVHRNRYAGRTLPMRTITWVDLRPHLDPPVTAQPLACYTTLTWQDVPMTAGGDLWAVAREVQERVDASVRGGARLVASAVSLPLMRMALATRKLRMGNTAISHTGLAPIGPRGPLDVQEIHAFVSNLALGPEFSVRSGVFDGRLVLDVMTLDTDMDRDEMQRLTREVLDTLSGVISV